MKKRILIAFSLFMAAILMVDGTSPAAAPKSLASCEAVVGEVNTRLDKPINEKELVAILKSLNASGDRNLPDRFVTKKRARKAGWQPGMSLWSIPALKGKSMGGDKFGNLEGSLPAKKLWREADLDYRGGKRGPKRIVFSSDGLRMVTVDHYKTFTEIPPCR